MVRTIMADHRATVSGRCDHCEWEALSASYTEMVKMYQDHLRTEHPETWMRS